MIKLLLRARLSALFHVTFAPSKKKKAGSAPQTVSRGKIALVIILFAYLAAVFIGMFFAAFFGLSMMYLGTANEWVYFSMFALLSFALICLGSTFTAKSEIFEAKDNELLLSMPIRPRDILASRMLSLLVFNFIMECIVAIPAAGVWVVLGKPSFLGVAAFLLAFFSIPFFGLAVSSLLAWGISMITAKMPKKTLATVVFTLLFFVLYFYFVSNAETFFAAFAENGALIAELMGGFLPLYWMGSAIANGNLLHILLSTLIYLVPFVLVYVILSYSFIKIVTTKSGSKKKQAAKTAQARATSVPRALLGREFSRLLGSATYILNSGVSIPLTLIAAVFVAIQGDSLLVSFAEIPVPNIVDLFGAILTVGLCMLTSMGFFTAASISLEGKTLWQLRSLPVTGQDVLRAKLMMSLCLTVPTNLIAGTVIAIAFKPSLPVILMLLLLPSLYAIWAANIGLICNLCHPVFDWINEAQAVKQGTAVFLTMLLTTLPIFVLAVIGAVLAFLTYWLSLIAIAGLMTLGIVLTYRYLMRGGVRRWNAL